MATALADNFASPRPTAIPVQLVASERKFQQEPSGNTSIAATGQPTTLSVAPKPVSTVEQAKKSAIVDQRAMGAEVLNMAGISTRASAAAALVQVCADNSLETDRMEIPSGGARATSQGKMQHQASFSTNSSLERSGRAASQQLVDSRVRH